jgi:hypothetical protein
MRDNTIEVFLNEEYGYRTWIWHPNMTEDEFISWWENLSDADIIKYFFNINSLPGAIRKYTERVVPGNALQREYGDPKSHRPYYYCHFHDVDDSYIAIGNNVYKFRSRMRYDWKEHWLDYQLAKAKS